MPTLNIYQDEQNLAKKYSAAAPIRKPIQAKPRKAGTRQTLGYGNKYSRRARPFRPRNRSAGTDYQRLINKEIADKLNISLTTVISHRKNITEKLGIKSVSGLTIYAVMHGYVEADRIYPTTGYIRSEVFSERLRPN